MPLPKDYYSNKLYPLQDEVLKVIASCENDFYLTGGTALSRGYLNHRFSDDLDFFLNGADNFSDQVDRVLSAIKKSGKEIIINKRAEDFVRIHCNAFDIELKIDFVNDIPYRSGTTESVQLFPRLDNWWNILSNKITALSRREPKDVVDILFLSRTYSFEWEKVFQEAEKKTNYVDPLDISVTLSEFPKDYFSKVNWVVDISFNDAFNDLQIIAKDILLKKINSLTNK